jgi:hypothetical protein|tara:strand:- start:54 stop:353 length:300 start_codon:yes stop_codon:yes gene_type:complete
MFLFSAFASTVGNRRNVNLYAANDTTTAHSTHARAPGSLAPPANAAANAAGAAAAAPSAFTSRSRLPSTIATDDDVDAIDRDVDARRDVDDSRRARAMW